MVGLFRMYIFHAIMASNHYIANIMPAILAYNANVVPVIMAGVVFSFCVRDM